MAPSLASEDRTRLQSYEDNARELTIVDYLAKALNADPRYANRARAKDAIGANLLCKPKQFYKVMADKRHAAEKLAARQGIDKSGLAKTAFDEIWDKAPQSIIYIASSLNRVGAWAVG